MESKNAVKIILDTDMSTDVDDAGALAVLHALADRGEAGILAVIHNTGHPLGVPVIEIINSYYERPDIPIGALKSDFDNEAARPYLTALVERFPSRLSRHSAPDAKQLYRQLLAAQPDASVVIVSIGFMTNLRALLESPPDEFSDLTGAQLIERKVKELVMQGGEFPVSSRPSWNYGHADAAPYTQAVIDHWPAPMTFLGYSIGLTTKTGASLEHSPETNPLRLAYYNFFDNHHYSRESWDLICVLYGVRGLGESFQRVSGGTNRILDDGNNEWDTSVVNPHHSYLVQLISDAELEGVLEDLLTQPPHLPVAH